MASIIDRTHRVPGVALGGRRAGILLACVAAATAAWVVGDPVPRLAADAETARLLRGMAMVKAAFLVPALWLVLWRAGADVGAGILLGYTACVTVMSAAAVLVWQLSFLGVTSLAFHASLIALLVLAWRDKGIVPEGSLRRR